MEELFGNLANGIKGELKSQKLIFFLFSFLSFPSPHPTTPFPSPISPDGNSTTTVRSGGGCRVRWERRKGVSGERGRKREKKEKREKKRNEFFDFSTHYLYHWPNYQKVPPCKISIKSFSFPNSFPNHLNFPFSIYTPISHLSPTHQINFIY